MVTRTWKRRKQISIGLVRTARALVLKKQLANYRFLCRELKVGIGSAHKILLRLKAEGVVAQGSRRRWLVLLDANGTRHREVREVKKTWRKAKHWRAGTPVEGAMTIELKIGTLRTLANAVGGRTATVLRAAATDLPDAELVRRLRGEITNGGGESPVDNVQMPIELVEKKALKSMGVPYSMAHIARLEAAGQFPKRIRLGECRVAWRYVKILQWIDYCEKHGPPKKGTY